MHPLFLFLFLATLVFSFLFFSFSCLFLGIFHRWTGLGHSACRLVDRILPNLTPPLNYWSEHWVSLCAFGRLAISVTKFGQGSLDNGERWPIAIVPRHLPASWANYSCSTIFERN